MKELPPTNTKKEALTLTGRGLAIGVSFGLIFGLLLNNLLMGMLFGVLIGVGVDNTVLNKGSKKLTDQ